MTRLKLTCQVCGATLSYMFGLDSASGSQTWTQNTLSMSFWSQNEILVSQDFTQDKAAWSMV